ncbi:hypothetical protein DYBT9275_03762 [Dyadobacter sp. CECT 9275]|uniref:FecR family protein n=1 Tax=Dyadobacter helix TaxID=2822344 RepID=A0A916NMF1_9BACT|nr:FecR family protein [Dyadobacter sp. CECT 9275]CAG5006224.1 hypothetical protein DYBT9275_03762 [Dyadobacter sp. CECT 9275]
MNRYQDYCVEDFVLDADFQGWVRYGTASQVAFWNSYIAEFPQQASEISEARILLQGIYVRYGTHISDDEIASEITGLITRILEDKKQRSASAGEDSFKSKKSWIWAAAASVLVAACGLAVWYVLQATPGTQYTGLTKGKSLVEKVNRTSSKQTIHLYDGSVAVLEPNASLSIPPAFSEEKREVYLSGEAYFKITKDIDRPFLVYTHKLVTRVLGTSFIVRALKGDQEISVEVREGKVSVFRKDDFEKSASGTQNESNGIVVTPNQKIVLNADGDRMVKTLSDAPAVVPGGVKVSRFDYNNTPVKDVLNDLKNAYQVDIIFDADLISDCPITATLSNQPLLEKLNVICEAIEAKYEVLDGKIIIYGNSCLN